LDHKVFDTYHSFYIICCMVNDMNTTNSFNQFTSNLNAHSAVCDK
jgi:hypothetical protein